MKVSLSPSNLKVGDVLYVKRCQYNSQWQGWPMVVEFIFRNHVRMRYQMMGDGTHDTITYDLETIANYLESL